MSRAGRLRRTLGRAGLYGLVALFLTYTLLPVLWMVVSSILVETDFIRLSSELVLPRRIQLGYYQANYTNRFDNLGVGRHPARLPTFEAGKIRLGYQIDAS